MTPFPKKWIPYLSIPISEVKDMQHHAYTDPFGTTQVAPKQEDVFKALSLIDPDHVKVVIIGQDPYPTLGHADGLAFSTQSDKTPKSLQNIFKIIKADYPEAQFPSNSLASWAQQGVLLLNTTLTCDVGEPNSHNHIGWQKLTQGLLQNLVTKQDIIIVAWGNQAQELTKNLRGQFDLITSSHPSPLSFSRGKQPFKDSSCFLKINQKLQEKNQTPINWSTK